MSRYFLFKCKKENLTCTSTWLHDASFAGIRHAPVIYIPKVHLAMGSPESSGVFEVGQEGEGVSDQRKWPRAAPSRCLTISKHILCTHQMIKESEHVAKAMLDE